MNQKDFLILTAIINNLIDLGVNIQEYIPEDRREKFTSVLDTKFSQFNDDEKLKEALIKELEKYVKRIN